VRALLLDIEGTTTPITFVTRVLFPHARARVGAFLEARAGDPGVRADLRGLAAEHAEDVRAGAGPPAWSDTAGSAAAYVHFLMDQDRKSTALKSLQGRMWAEGYAQGELRGEVYEDVPRALARWRAQGRAVAIFSSGSVLAQKLIFRHLPGGDLTPFLRAYFDTTTGPKREARSYAAIASVLGVEPPAVLFLSDVTEELDAARAGGMKTALCVREGAHPPAHPAHPVVRTFDEVCPEGE
jgi:enolase-phosphatase E1